MIRTIFAAAAAAVIAVTTVATGALAHSRSEKTEPADGATVEAVETIAIGFNEPMRVTSVKLMRGGEETAIERETGMEPVTRFTAKPGADLAPGAYTVEWRGLSADGHAMSGGFSFTLAK